MMTNDELQSNTINFLRFPLIVGVIFIHNFESTMVVQGIEMGNNVDMPIYHIFSELFSHVIGRVSVPLFFFISGFLFFLNVNFDKDVYISKIRKRINTLLVPYLFWNIAILVFYYIVSHLPGLSAWFRGVTYTWNYVFFALWGRINDMRTAAYPIAYQFWFIRDLMVLVLMSPLVYWFLKNTKKYGLICIGLLWFFEMTIPYIGIRGMSTVAWFFFMAGGWFSIYRKNLVEEFRKVGSWIYLLYIGATIVYLCTFGNTYSVYIQDICILTGIVCAFKITIYLLNRGLKVIPFLSSVSFFVFAIHEPWLLSQIRKILFKLFQPQSDGMLTFLYFFIVICVIVVALVLYYIFKIYISTFYSSGYRR